MWSIWEHPEDPQLDLLGPLQQLFSEAAAAKQECMVDMQEEQQTSLCSRGLKSAHLHVELVIVLESGNRRRGCFPSYQDRQSSQDGLGCAAVSM